MLQAIIRFSVRRNVVVLLAALIAAGQVDRAGALFG